MIRRILALIVLAAVSAMALAACGAEPAATPAPTPESAETAQAEPEQSNVLVAYFSWSGNTAEMAAYIAEQTGGDLLEIQPETPYPEDYGECGDVALAERDADARPAIANLPESLDGYDALLIGYPIWWHTAPMIIGTFLESFDLTGVDVYPFTQSASMDTEQFANSVAFVTDCAPGASVHDGLFARPDDTAEIDAYLDANGLAANAEQTAYAFETRETYFRRDGMSIYAQLYVPEAAQPLPAVIYSHGFAGSHASGAQYAEALAAQGYVVCTFDFRGGSPSGRSGGETTEMSIFTELADLNAVIDAVSALEYVDAENIFLMGASQGGVVSALAAAERPDDIRGLMLLYPAFVLVDEANARYQSAADIPDTEFFMWMDVGRAYFEPLLDYDIYAAIAPYERDVLLIHGDADSLVPLEYSRRAQETYTSAELHVLPGAGHGFYGSDAAAANGLISEYLNSHTI